MKNFMRLLGREKKMRRGNLGNVSERSSAKKQENIRLNSVNSRKTTSLLTCDCK